MNPNSAAPDLGNAPRDLFVYYSKEFTFPQIVQARAVCRHWREMIDNPNNDVPVFKRFVVDNLPAVEAEKQGDDPRYWFNRAKQLYMQQKEAEKQIPPQAHMDHVALPVNHRHNRCCSGDCCCSGCTESERLIVCAALICAVFTCCGCCCCCGQSSLW